MSMVNSNASVKSYSGNGGRGFLFLDSAKLDDVSKTLLEKSATLSEYNSDIEKKIASLGEHWVGPDYDEFVKVYNEFKPSLEQLSTLFSNYSGTVGGLSSSGETLISTVKQYLDCSSIGVTLSDNIERCGGLYKAEDVGLNVTVTGPTNEAKSALAYGTNVAGVTTAKQALKQAEDIQSNLYYDIEVIDVERRNEAANLAALEKSKDLLTPEQYQEFKADIESRIERLDLAYEQYVNAYNYVADLNSNKSADVMDLIKGQERDGKIRGAADGIFGYHDDVKLAKEGLQEIEYVLSGLAPLTTIVQSSQINGVVATQNEYHMDSFRNGVNVTDNAMNVSFAIASNQENGTSEIAPGIVTFNSKNFVTDGLNETYNYMGGTTSVFSQIDAYGYDGINQTFENGHDSVRVDTGDGYTYMTYAQFQKSPYNPDNIDMQ